jgi:phosphoenolpyruvate carboxykinase (diphosphate)
VGDAAARDAVSQALHGFWRRQIGDLQAAFERSLLRGPVIVADYHQDMDEVAEHPAPRLLGYLQGPAARCAQPASDSEPERSLGSVIKLLTPSAEYNDAYNAWLRKSAQTSRQLVFTVKRYYRPEWGDNWREHFSVDRINGAVGHELKFAP